MLEPVGIYDLLMLVRTGGAIVSYRECDSDEIVLARNERRLASDHDGHSYVWRPPTTVRRRSSTNR